MILDRVCLARRVGILINDVDDPRDHIFFFAIAKQVLFWHAFVNVLVAPYFQLPSLTDMKHILKDLKIPIVSI